MLQLPDFCQDSVTDRVLLHSLQFVKGPASTSSSIICILSGRVLAPSSWEISGGMSSCGRCLSSPAPLPSLLACFQHSYRSCFEQLLQIPQAASCSASDNPPLHLLQIGLLFLPPDQLEPGRYEDEVEVEDVGALQWGPGSASPPMCGEGSKCSLWCHSATSAHSSVHSSVCIASSGSSGRFRRSISCT